MRAWELTAWSRDGLQIVERAEPVPDSGQLVIEIAAASVNYRDLVMVNGGYGRAGGTLPIVPGSDGAGRVIAIGDGVDPALLGQSVIPSFFQDWLSGRFPADALTGALGGPLDGVLQERMVLEAAGVVPAPEGWTALEAATLPCAAITAWGAVSVLTQTRPGDVVVVEGTGGVACFAVQFAHLCGAHVVVVSSSDEKLARVQSLGADTLINYRSVPDWGKDIRNRIGGADLIVDLGGAETLGQALRAVRPGGTIALIGVLSGGLASVPLGPAVTREVRFQSVTCGSRDDLRDMVHALNASDIRPVVDRTYAFEGFPAALDRLESAKHVGKVCVDVAS